MIYSARIELSEDIETYFSVEVRSDMEPTVADALLDEALHQVKCAFAIAQRNSADPVA